MAQPLLAACVCVIGRVGLAIRAFAAALAVSIALGNAALTDVGLPQRDAIFCEHFPEARQRLLDRVARQRVLRMKRNVSSTIVESHLHPQRTELCRCEPNFGGLQLVARHHQHALGDAVSPCRVADVATDEVGCLLEHRRVARITGCNTADAQGSRRQGR